MVKGDEENAKRYIRECVDIRKELLGTEHRDFKDAEHLLHEILNPVVQEPPPPPPPPQISEGRYQRRGYLPDILTESVRASGGVPPILKPGVIPPPPPSSSGGIPPPPPPLQQRRAPQTQQQQQQQQQFSLEQEVNRNRGNLRHQKAKHKEYDGKEMCKKMQGMNKRKIAMKELW